MSEEQRANNLGIDPELRNTDPLEYLRRLDQKREELGQTRKEHGRLARLPTEELLKLWEARDELTHPVRSALIDVLMGREVWPRKVEED